MSANQDIPYTQDQADDDWTDQLTLATTDAGVASAGVIWASDDALVDVNNVPIPQYNTGIASTNTTGGNTVVQSWEFGGYGGDQTTLATDYADFIAGGGGGGGPQFKRGDTNQDGGFNIADEVFLLAALFSGGTSWRGGRSHR